VSSAGTTACTTAGGGKLTGCAGEYGANGFVEAGAGAGTRTVIGVMLGVVFFLILRTVENGGQLFGLNPVLIGWLPTTVLGFCTLVAIARTR